MEGTLIGGGGSGDVVGIPGLSTPNAIVRWTNFDGISIKNSSRILENNGRLTTNIFNLPTSTNLGEGVIEQNGEILLHTFGNRNIHLGRESNSAKINSGTGNNVTVGSNNMVGYTTSNHCQIFGTNSGKSLTSGNNNQFCGFGAGEFVTDSNNCVYFGQDSGSQNSGSFNTFLGSGSGTNCTIANSSVMINNPGETNDNNLTRIGENEVTEKCFISGVHLVTNNNFANSKMMVTIDEKSQLGTAPMPGVNESIMCQYCISLPGAPPNFVFSGAQNVWGDLQLQLAEITGPIFASNFEIIVAPGPTQWLCRCISATPFDIRISGSFSIDLDQLDIWWFMVSRNGNQVGSKLIISKTDGYSLVSFDCFMSVQNGTIIGLSGVNTISNAKAICSSFVTTIQKIY